MATATATKKRGKKAKLDPDSHVCTVEKAALQTAFNLCDGVVPKRPTHPILANYRIVGDTTTGAIWFEASDLVQFVRLKVQVALKNGFDICVSAALFKKAIGTLDGEIAFYLADQELTVTQGKSSFKFPCATGTEFPSMPDIDDGADSITVRDPERIWTCLDFASKDPSKGVLRGVLFGEDMVGATDGHRCLTVTYTPGEPDDPVAYSNTQEVVLAVEFLGLLKKIAPSGGITVRHGGGIIHYSTDDVDVYGRVLEGQYPNLKQLIPKHFTQKITVNKDLILDSLARVEVICEQMNYVCKLWQDEIATLIIGAEAAEVGEAREEVEVLSDQLLPEMGMNLKYLRAMFKSIPTSEVCLQISGQTSPMVAIGVGNTEIESLVMPVQIRK